MIRRLIFISFFILLITACTEENIVEVKSTMLLENQINSIENLRTITIVDNDVITSYVKDDVTDFTEAYAKDGYLIIIRDTIMYFNLEKVKQLEVNGSHLALYF